MTGRRGLTATDHRNGHHTGADRECWRCAVRTLLRRTPPVTSQLTGGSERSADSQTDANGDLQPTEDRS